MSERERGGGGGGDTSCVCVRERERHREILAHKYPCVFCAFFLGFFLGGGGGGGGRQTSVQLEKNNLRSDVEKQQMTSVLSLESLFSSVVITPLPGPIAPY